MGVIDSLVVLIFSWCVESNTLLIRTCWSLCYSFIPGLFPHLWKLFISLPPPFVFSFQKCKNLVWHTIYGKTAMKCIVYEITRLNIPNLLRAWKTTVGFIRQWFKKSSLANEWNKLDIKCNRAYHCCQCHHGNAHC